MRSALVIEDAPYNPRAISSEAMAGLAHSLGTFGDLSGIVVNRRTGHIVCGHQRRRALENLQRAGIDLGAAAWGQEFVQDLGPAGKRFKSRERLGELVLRSGDGSVRFAVREVDWPATFEKAANMAANNPAVQGTWTPDAAALLAELQQAEPDLTRSLMLDQIRRELPKPAAAAADGEPEEIVSYPLVVDCVSDDQRKELVDRLRQEGFACRAARQQTVVR